VIGRKDLKVNALMLFLMCRDPRSSATINEELGKALIQHAKPDILNAYYKEVKVFPLALAADRSIKMAGMMLDAGADPNAQDSYGNTMLMMAAAGNELEVVRFLLSAGADVSRKNKIGINAIGYADCFDADNVRAVLKAGSSVSEGADVCRKMAQKTQ
jgi:ankyrin repeat protein